MSTKTSTAPSGDQLPHSRLVVPSTRWRVLVLLLVAASTHGCGEVKYPVKGKVQFTDGTPLTGGMVFFDEETGLNGGYGVVNPDGSFEITFDTPLDGLPKNSYRVSVRPQSRTTMTEEEKKNAPPLGGIPQKYLNSETSGIVVKIDRAVTDLVIELEKSKPVSEKAAPK
jgi:hypothetical protein